MLNLFRSVVGVLYVDPETGHVYTSLNSLAEMCGVSMKAVKRFLCLGKPGYYLNSITEKTQRQHKIPTEDIVRCLQKWNQPLLKALAQAQLDGISTTTQWVSVAEVVPLSGGAGMSTELMRQFACALIDSGEYPCVLGQMPYPNPHYCVAFLNTPEFREVCKLFALRSKTCK